MHELGILWEIVKTVNRIITEKEIRTVKHITLEVGELSGFVPQYLTKLFPMATDGYPALKHTRLLIHLVAGRGLVIKDIGY